jgi:hypothetical protein
MAGDQGSCFARALACCYGTDCRCGDCSWCREYVYRAVDGVGVEDPAIRAYGCEWVDRVCRRAGPWKCGKAIMRFGDQRVVVRTRLLRRVV